MTLPGGQGVGWGLVFLQGSDEAGALGQWLGRAGGWGLDSGPAQLRLPGELLVDLVLKAGAR